MNIGIRSIIAILIVCIIAIPTIAGTQPSGTPFDDIWNEINNIKSTITNLQDQINNIQLTPGPKGDQGIQGEPGPKGDQGIQGESGISGYEMVKLIHTFESGIRGDVSVSCPQGKHVLGGGYYLNFNEGYWDELRIFGSYPMSNGEGWFFSARNVYGTSKNVDIYAICANV